MRWELELVGCSSGFVENLEGSDTFVVKLLLGSREVKVGSVQPYAVSNVVGACVSLLLFILCFHVVSHLLKSVAGLFMDLGHGCGEFSSCRVCEWRRSGRVGKDMGVLPIEYHEWALACRTVYPIVVGELSE